MLHAAVIGKQYDIVKYILSFCYLANDSIMYENLCKQVKAADYQGNTLLHYSYDYDLPDIRSLLKEHGLFFF